MMRTLSLSLAVGALLVCARASAQGYTLRLASVAPEGTAWARELKSFGREVEASSGGNVRIKWYLGGIAGDDVPAGERIRRDQLDGVASGGMLCERLAPSMRVLRLQGVFQSRSEAAYVIRRLSATLDEEMLHAGFINLGETGLGPGILFTRTPVRSMSDLKRLKLWIWESDQIKRRMSDAMGLQTVPLPLEAAAKAYETGQTDGFLAIPSAALAFQWYARSRYIEELKTDYFMGCLVISSRAFDRLPVEYQSVVRAAGAKLMVHNEALGRQQDEQLLGGLFERQGLVRVPVSDDFRSEFLASARAARERLGDGLVPRALLEQVLGLLADYRAAHSGEERR